MESVNLNSKLSQPNQYRYPRKRYWSKLTKKYKTARSPTLNRSVRSQLHLRRWHEILKPTSPSASTQRGLPRSCTNKLANTKSSIKGVALANHPRSFLLGDENGNILQ